VEANSVPAALEQLCDHMLLILIPILWLAVAAFFVFVCRGAAQADSLMASTPARTLTPTVRRGAVTLFEDRHAIALHDARLGRAGLGRGGALTARGGRARGGRCAAGS